MPFEKGRSGNPAGRPRGFAGLAREIRKETADGAELVAFALEVFRNASNELKDRWAALQWLGDRGFGKPMQSIELAAHVSADVDVQAALPAPSIDVTAFSDEQLEAALAAANAALAIPVRQLKAGDSEGE